MIHSIMVRGLVPPCQMWVLSHSDVTVGLVPTWSDISAKCHSWNGGTWSVTRKAQSGTEGHSDVIVGLVPTWSDVSAEPFWHWLSDVSAEPFRREGLVPCMVEYKWWALLTLVVRCKCRSFWHGGLVPHMAKCKCWAIPIIGWTDVSAGPFWQGCGLCYHMVKCEWWALPFLIWL